MSEHVQAVAEIAQARDDTQGIVAVALSVAFVSFIVVRGKNQIKQLTIELEEMGFDLTNVEPRIGTLKYLKREVEAGNEKIAREVVAAAQAERSIAFGSTLDVVKWREYYQKRGVKFESVGDLRNVKEYVRNLQENK